VVSLTLREGSGLKVLDKKVLWIMFRFKEKEDKEGCRI
jgi:hypothetical protein